MKIALSIGVTILGALFFSACSSPSQQSEQQESVTQQAMEVNENQDNSLDAMDSTTENSMGETSMQQQESGAESNTSIQAEYVDYSPTAVADATANGDKAVLFFHASWCPTCKAAERDILDNLSSLPANVTVIKTDFDSNAELKRQYSITNQHTFVQVDAQGEEVTRWVGGGADQVSSRIQ